MLKLMSEPTDIADYEEITYIEPKMVSYTELAGSTYELWNLTMFKRILDSS